MLLKTMLREAGLRAELWVARDNFGADLKPGGNPLFESYDSPYLAVWTGESETPTMVITGSKVLPLGYLVPGLSGAAGFRVPLAEDDPAPGAVKFPARPAWSVARTRTHTFSRGTVVCTSRRCTPGLTVITRVLSPRGQRSLRSLRWIGAPSR